MILDLMFATTFTGFGKAIKSQNLTRETGCPVSATSKSIGLKVKLKASVKALFSSHLGRMCVWKSMAEISVIIVNYNTAGLAIEAVQSILARHHKGRTVDVHLLDNGSLKGDSAVLLAAATKRNWGTNVTLYLEAKNHGFGRGNNIVLEALGRRPSPPDMVFLLNPDARLKNEAVGILADFLDAHPRAGVAGARIEKPGSIPVTSAFRFPGLISEFAGAAAFGPLARLCAHWQVPRSTDLATSPTDWVAGAALMARFKALAEVDFFDPAYFLYYEEVDLMRQTARRGWETWHVAEAEVVHMEGAATGVKSGEYIRKRRPAYWYHSWQHYFRKNYGRIFALLAAGAWMLGALLNHAIARLRGKAPAAPLHLFQDFWAMAGRPLLGLKARPHD
jgi:GT2 family glycosyltransferase